MPGADSSLQMCKETRISPQEASFFCLEGEDAKMTHKLSKKCKVPVLEFLHSQFQKACVKL